MRKLWLYAFLSRAGWLNYRAKIMTMAFLGTHIPLLAIIGFFVERHVADPRTALLVIGVALVATLVGTAITLFVLNHLLQPILLASAGLRGYRNARQVPQLPTNFSDEAGTLMADTVHTLSDLDRAMDDLAHYDKTTGLPNRSRLLAALAERTMRDGPFMLCAVRLGNYERLGATFDQETADAVLRRIAGRLTAATAADAFASRVDSGLFAFILDADEAAEPTARAEQVAAALRGEIGLHGLSVVPELLVGASLFPDDAREADTLLDLAIAALGSAGPAQECRLTFFSAAAREAARSRFLIEQELRRALDAQEFTLHYQPIVDVRLGRAVGAEALIRWNHPERGLLPPAAFIPAAEASGLIEPIGAWVLRAACAQLKQWAAGGHHALKLAINVSARQFGDDKLTRLLDDTLRQSGVPPEWLEVELTETVAMQNRDRTREVFGSLRELGVSIALDDFGTGYSSMSYLKNLPFDKLKIDREFVTNVESLSTSQAICGALIELARGLGIAVLAEGAEAEQEVRYLEDRGCALFQGYFFSRPVPAEAFMEATERLSRHTPLVAAA